MPVDVVMALVKGLLTIRAEAPDHVLAARAGQKTRRCVADRSIPVIWMTGEDRHRPIQLLQKHNSDQLMRPSGSAEAER